MPDGYAVELQKALVAALRDDSGVTGRVSTRIYDHVPQGVTRPYLQIGGIIPRPLRTDGKAAASMTFGIEAHSRPVKSGRVEATRCIEAVVAALDEVPMTVTGFTPVLVQWLTQDVTKDDDGESYTAIAVFQVILDG